MEATIEKSRAGAGIVARRARSGARTMKDPGAVTDWADVARPVPARGAWSAGIVTNAIV
jgi:hypothetical protein